MPSSLLKWVYKAFFRHTFFDITRYTYMYDTMIHIHVYLSASNANARKRIPHEIHYRWPWNSLLPRCRYTNRANKPRHHTVSGRWAIEILARVILFSSSIIYYYFYYYHYSNTVCIINFITFTYVCAICTRIAAAINWVNAIKYGAQSVLKVYTCPPEHDIFSYITYNNIQ